MARLTVRAAFEQLLALANTSLRCCICGDDSRESIVVELAKGRFDFRVCSPRCAYELGSQSAAALALLAAPAVRAVPAGRAAGVGAGRRTSAHAGTVTRGRRKNGTRTAKRAKTRG
jgi:hypothetical protein